MSAPRRDRLEANLAKAAKSRVARWQRYAAVTGSAMAMATNASLSGLVAGKLDSTAAPDSSLLAALQPFASLQNEPALRSVRLAMARRNSTLSAEAAALEAVRATQVNAPTISPGGVVALYSSVNMIQPGGWVSIYGTNLAAGTAVWNGDFPTSLGGTSVTINGKPAYLSFVNPNQINLQAPDDSTTGPVSVVVTTGAGQATATVTLSPYSPSFELLDTLHVAAIIVRANGGGAFGNGSYDILGPDGDCLGYPTVSASPGDLVELFGVGFGPTNPVVHAGSPFSGSAPITNNLNLYINNTIVTPVYVGMSAAGMYQINVIIPPGLGQGDVPRVVGEALRAGGAADLALALLSLAAIPAFAEEVFFRGLMQGALSAAWGRWPGIVAAAVAFGALHLDPAQGTLALTLGVLLGWICDRLGGVRASVVAHGANNGSAVLLATAHPTTTFLDKPGWPIAGGLLLALAGIAVLRSPRAVRASTPAS